MGHLVGAEAEPKKESRAFLSDRIQIAGWISGDPDQGLGIQQKEMPMPYRRHPSSADVVAANLARRGIRLDPQRVEEIVAAERSRKQIENREHLKAVRSAASAVVKAKRAYSQALAVLASNPIGGNKQHAIDCKLASDAATEQLSELCLHDEAVIGAALRQAHLR